MTYRKAGKGAWKFVFESGKVYYAENNGHCLKTFHVIINKKISADIYRRNPKGGWIFITHIHQTDHCQCGQTYTNSQNSEYFRAQNTVLIYRNFKDIETIVKAPYLCQECYYRIEWQQGRWCPKYWKQKFEL